MVIHSDSYAGFLISGLITLATLSAFAIAVGLALNRRFRSALRIVGVTAAMLCAWVSIVTLISFASPQVIVKVGDSYCEDIRCIGIDAVHTDTKGPETVYALDLRLFSEANTVKVNFRKVTFVLSDGAGRRFPAVAHASGDDLYRLELDPGQTVKTSLTFSVPSDVHPLYLIDTPRTVYDGTDPSAGRKPQPARAPLAAWWFYLASPGNDASLLHKPTLLRVI
jgi:hypothetical protein